MRVTWLGHSCFLIESRSARVIVDPFLSGNDKAPLKPEHVDVDAILLTHGHSDHVGDTLAIARRLHIPVVAVFELATWLGWQGLETHAQHIGGQVDYPFGRVRFVPAVHGAGLTDETRQTITYAGNPAGILYTVDGKTVYHLGDTGLTCEMELVGRRNRIDLALVPIGGCFTMDSSDGAEAVRLIKPAHVVPCHYDTWPPIAQDPAEFVREVGSTARVTVLEPGGSLEI